MLEKKHSKRQEIEETTNHIFIRLNDVIKVEISTDKPRNLSNELITCLTTSVRKIQSVLSYQYTCRIPPTQIQRHIVNGTVHMKTDRQTSP